MMITSKNQIIKYFKSGIRKPNQFKIGIEHEKFLFDLTTNKRVNYQTILKMFKNLYEFGWKPILENENIIGLKKGGKSITLEPGNQIELSGDQLNNIHEACSESQDYLFEIKQVINIRLDYRINKIICSKKKSSFIVFPSNDGDSATFTPHSRKALILDFAVPLSPEIIAPA